MKNKYDYYKCCLKHFSATVFFQEEDCPLCTTTETIERFIEAFGRLKEEEVSKDATTNMGRV